MRPSAPPNRAGLLLAVVVFGLAGLLMPAHGHARPAARAERMTPLLLAVGPAAATSTPTAEPTKKPRATKAPATKATPEVLVEQRLGRSSRRTVALTFDDGPDPAWTPQVLALLRKHHAVATFCMIGEHVQANPALVRKVVKAGMRLCDHTQTHPVSLAALDVADQRHEITAARADLAAVTKASVPYFRAPGGNWSPEVATLAAAKKMQPLGWTVDPRDWSQPGTDEIVSRVEDGVTPGAIVLMHDGGGPREQTVAALQDLLPWLVEHGYRFTFPTP